MKISKKLLSLLLAVTMLVSVCSIAASAAWTLGDQSNDTNTINVKYTVAKAAEAPMGDGSGSYVGDDIYGVTVWAQSVSPIACVTAPVHYNKAHFAPIMLWDGDVTYPVGAGMDQDTWYTDMAEGTNYVYSYGSYMSDTGMYKANGTTASTKALAKYIGMGNSNHEGIETYTELLSPDHGNYAKWTQDVDTTKYGVMYLSLNVGATVKSAYFNTYCKDGAFGINTEWVDMGTLYFQRLDGVTDADVVGDIFGNTSTNGTAFGPDGVIDLCGTLYCTVSSTQTVPVMNFVSNATVEAAKPDPEVTVVGAQSKWATGVAGKDYAFGYVGQLANFEVDTNDDAVVTDGAKNVANITSITATVKINGVTKTRDVHTIWSDGDVYKFRAKFTGFDFNSTLAVEEMSFTVVTADGTFTSTNYAGTDTINSIYLASVGNGLAAA